MKGGVRLKIDHYKLRIALILIGIITAAVFVGFLIFYDNTDIRQYDTSITMLSDGWTADNGKTYDLKHLPDGKSELTKDISGIPLKNMSFCTKSIDTYFDIYADGVKIYSYQKNTSPISGWSYGRNMHMVPLDEGTKNLRLVLTPAFEKENPLLADTVIADAGNYMGEFFSKEMPDFCICIYRCSDGAEQQACLQ